MRWARERLDVKATSNSMPFGLQPPPGLDRFLDAKLGEVGVLPAGEEVLEIPIALAVTDEDEKAVH